MCVTGARWAQKQILEKHPGLDLAVYAVWYNMVASDARKRWPEGLLDDPRVTHLWDEERVVGRWFATKPALGDCGLGGQIAGDAYYLFPKDARWGDAPAPLITSGCPIVRERERLEAAVEVLVKEARKAHRGG